MGKIIKIVLISLIPIVMLTSCNFDESDNIFKGGQLLDAEQMSQIKNDILNAEGNPEESGKTVDTEDESKTESTMDTGSGDDKDNVEQTELETDCDSLVYWTKNGTVWHTDRECSRIKKSDVVEGTVEEAIAAGKERICSFCDK